MHREFSVGDNVYLRVRPRKSSLKVGSCSKMSPRYCDPFEVLERIGLVTYRLAFPGRTRAHNVFQVSLLKKYVHDLNHVFHVSFLKKYVRDPNHVINWDVI